MDEKSISNLDKNLIMETVDSTINEETRDLEGDFNTESDLRDLSIQAKEVGALSPTNDDQLDLHDLLNKAKDVENAVDEEHHAMDLVQLLKDSSVASDAQMNAKSNEPTKKKKKSPPKAKWIQRHSFTMTTEEWNNLHKFNKLIKGRYDSVFIKMISQFKDMSCVLMSSGYTYSDTTKLFVIRFVCAFEDCRREYLVRQIEGSNFVIFDNGGEIVHEQVKKESTNMKNKCIVCGLINPFSTKNSPETVSPTIDWIGCNCCGRWTHIVCIAINNEGIDDSFKKYVCIICEANTPIVNNQIDEVVHETD